jgi:hypothetical protein
LRRLAATNFRSLRGQLFCKTKFAMAGAPSPAREARALPSHLYGLPGTR